MSTPPGGPYDGSNVPPPPPGPGGGSYGQTQPPQHQYGQTQPPQGQYGQSPGDGQPPYGQHHQPPQPYGQQPHAPGGQPPKKGMSKGVIAAIAGVVALLLLILCCGGFFLLTGDDSDGDDTSTSSSTTDSSTTDSSTTEPSSSTTSSSSAPTTTSSSPAGGDFSFPSSFDGWSKMGYTPSSSLAGQSVAAYTKGGKSLSVVVAEGAGVSASDFESLWSDDEQVGDSHCGMLSSTRQCAAEQDGKVFLVTATNGEDATTTAGYLDQFLDAI